MPRARLSMWQEAAIQWDRPVWAPAASGSSPDRPVRRYRERPAKRYKRWWIKHQAWFFERLSQPLIILLRREWLCFLLSRRHKMLVPVLGPFLLHHKSHLFDPRPYLFQ